MRPATGRWPGRRSNLFVGACGGAVDHGPCRRAPEMSLVPFSGRVVPSRPKRVQYMCRMPPARPVDGSREARQCRRTAPSRRCACAVSGNRASDGAKCRQVRAGHVVYGYLSIVGALRTIQGNPGKARRCGHDGACRADTVGLRRSMVAAGRCGVPTVHGSDRRNITEAGAVCRPHAVCRCRRPGWRAGQRRGSALDCAAMQRRHDH